MAIGKPVAFFYLRGFYLLKLSSQKITHTIASIASRKYSRRFRASLAALTAEYTKNATAIKPENNSQ